MDTNESNEMVGLDINGLYREESITDMAVGVIRAFIPINVDGTVDESRTPRYMANSHVQSPMGPIPIQGTIEDVTNLDEALAKFPETIQSSLDQMYEEAQREALAAQAEENDTDAPTCQPEIEVAT